jgi:uncharacterized protein YPO0396
MKVPEFEFNADNTQIGFRLDYMELLNWGTFNQRIWKIVPKGNNSLLTGDIGSGKSTVVDALTCLFVRHDKIIFNKAAGAENKERTLASYIRGEYKNVKNELSDATERRKGKAVGLRYNNENNITYSVILANFYNVGYFSNVTLAQVFWIENEKVQKLLIISTKALEIKENFENIEDVKILKQRMKSLSNIKYIGDNFSEYTKELIRSLGMNSDKAIDLFYQTVSMKSVGSLTSFVREHMLEQTDVKDKIEELKKRFVDLSRAYNAIKEIRQQRDALFPLIEFNKTYNDCKQQIEEVENIIDLIYGYFADKKIMLLETEIKDCEAKLNQLGNKLQWLNENIKEKENAKRSTENDIDNNGGARLKEILREKELCETTKTTKNEKYKTYADLLSFCNLPSANTDRTFYSNLKTAQNKIESLEEIQEKNHKKFGEKTADLRNANENIEKAEIELKSLKSRKNQIPLSLLDVRQQLMDDLHIAESEMPFVGELIMVKNEENRWEGALEKLLHGFGISLLVSEKYYNQVSGYINNKALFDRNQRGIKLDYFSIPQNLKSKNKFDIPSDSVVNKIDIKDNLHFKDWLQSELGQRFNLHCVSMEEFQKIHQDAITIEGQYRKGKRHTKDDRTKLWDRTKFVLGWSNTEKIKAIEQNLENDLKPKQDAINKELECLETDIKTNSELNIKLNILITNYQNWNDLNWQYEAKKIEELKREEFDITTSNDVLKSLQGNLAKIVEEITKLENDKTKQTEEIGKIKGKVEQYTNETTDCRSTTSTILEEKSKIYYPKIDKLIEQITLTFKNIDKMRDNLKNQYDGKNGKKDQLNETLNDASKRIIKIMQNYKNLFPADSLELSAEQEFLPEFVQKYEKIINEGLPEHENRFKEMLKRNTIEDIRVFDFKLESHSKQIKEKIKEINKHLKEIEFNKGTYISISNESISDKEINDFKKDLRDCYADIFDTSDAYTENRFNMVKKFLDRFMSNETKDIEWTKKVTDVRNWFLFSVNELRFEDDTEKEYYSDSSGKSGGQKEKLAYTILASALVYQFGLSYGEPRSKSFRFVVIDEAFGRGSDESTKFGLELFKKLNLQLLVVTPLQKIHVIENYVNTVHIVSNNEAQNNSEIQYLTAEEFKREKQQRMIKVIQETAQ